MREFFQYSSECVLVSPYLVVFVANANAALNIHFSNDAMQSSIHHFMSKWMDATIHTAVFHLQNRHYDDFKPPTFFDHDGLNELNLSRARKRRGQMGIGESGARRGLDDSGDALFRDRRRLNSVVGMQKVSMEDPFDRSAFRGDDDDSVHSRSLSGSGGRLFASLGLTRLTTPPSPGWAGGTIGGVTIGGSILPVQISPYASHASPGRRQNPLPESVLKGEWESTPASPQHAGTDALRRAGLAAERFPAARHPNSNFAFRPESVGRSVRNRRGGTTPPLFLQELVHLSSLAAAVALSTLRNDVDDEESPLDVYVPGSPWPPPDPARLPKNIRAEFQSTNGPLRIIKHFFMFDRHPSNRAKYNRARPMPILGGVSDAEIRYLQMARGPYAKSQLALGWLVEFIVREHIAGSLGDVHSSIISRMVQFTSDGMIHYNLARKVMYIPFPFPHAQLSIFFTAVMVFAVPFMLDQYAESVWLGSFLTFLTVTCLVGLHEVARELENPFRNYPNELPLCTIMAMYNEALVTCFGGYGPDSFWDPEAYQGALGAGLLGRVCRGGEKGEGGRPPKAPVAPAVPDLAPERDGGDDGGGKAAGGTASGDGDERKAAAELRDMLRRQAAEIEELERRLRT